MPGVEPGCVLNLSLGADPGAGCWTRLHSPIRHLSFSLACLAACSLLIQLPGCPGCLFPAHPFAWLAWLHVPCLSFPLAGLMKTWCWRACRWENAFAAELVRLPLSWCVCRWVDVCRWVGVFAAGISVYNRLITYLQIRRGTY